MNRGKIISPAEVDFWLDSDKYGNLLNPGADSSDKDALIFSVDMVRLSSIRKAVANFVRILTRQSIPVYFNDANANFNLAGKSIYISAAINSKQDFDVAVGQALHEGAHTLKTDFDVVKTCWANIPTPIFKLSDSKGIRRASLERFIHDMWNVIEDRYIDAYIFNEAPGYRGYYAALYERFWNSPQIDELLLSDNFRFPSLFSYNFRITNFTNPNTDLTTLPRLEDIARVIDISHIDRLSTTKDRVKKAFEVTEIVLDCLDKELPSNANGAGKKSNKSDPAGKPALADPRDYFDFGEEEQSEEEPQAGDKDTKKEAKESEKNDGNKESEEDIDVGQNIVNEISDILNGKNPNPEKPAENSDIVNKTAEEDIPKEVQKKIDDVIQSQRQFLAGEIPKSQVTEQQKSLLDLIEKHGIVLVKVDLPTVLAGDDKNLKVDCIVVQEMTKELVLSGHHVFPLSGAMKLGGKAPEPEKDVADAVKKGILLGTKLGRKLQIRAEINPIKTIRRKWGKINKRQLHEAAFDAEDLFYKLEIDEHHKASLHITVDASGSMAGTKWLRTMTAVVAICKAASMIDNIHVTVSFRSTQFSGDVELPYVVLAYDSRKDKFSKVRTLFPYLLPNGCTPEGLAFGAIMNLFEGITPDEEERYFLNLSDGQPFYALRVPDTGLSISYSGDVGTIHTKSQVDKLRRLDIRILSYFIEEDYGTRFRKLAKKKPEEMTKEEREKEQEEAKQAELAKEQDPIRKDFRKMYGKDAKFIDVESIIDLAKTINALFLSKNGGV